MADSDDTLWIDIPAPRATPREPELLFEFVRRDGTPMRCELVFNGESYGWEARLIAGTSSTRTAGSSRRESAVRWAERERDAMLGRVCGLAPNYETASRQQSGLTTRPK